jgi:cytidine deaminase
MDYGEVNWAYLYDRAVAAATKAYCPYSGIHVGAAGITENGRLVEGSNVENAIYGLTMCAETAMVANLITRGGGKLAAICVIANNRLVVPCGHCRQVLHEHSLPDAVLWADGIINLSDKLPNP